MVPPLGPGGTTSYQTTFKLSIASADARNEAALREAVLSILAAAGLTAVDAAAVTITSDSERRRLSRGFAAPPRTSIRRRLRATVAVTVEVTLPSQSDADLAEAALVDAISDPSTASSSRDAHDDHAKQHSTEHRS